MTFPEHPTCHDGQHHARQFQQPGAAHAAHWREPEVRAEGSHHGYPQNYPFRTCSYCGSIHAGDLVRALEQGARLSASDWKYGYPHKYYVDNIPGGLAAGTRVQIGSESRPVREGDDRDVLAAAGATFETIAGIERVSIPKFGSHSGTAHGKFYTAHILDEGFDGEARARLLELLSEHTPENWWMDEEGRLMYQRLRSPLFQKPTV